VPSDHVAGLWPVLAREFVGGHGYRVDQAIVAEGWPILAFYVCCGRRHSLGAGWASLKPLKCALVPSVIVIHVLHPTRLVGPLGAAGSAFSVRKRFKSSGAGYSENINLPVGSGVVGVVAVMLLMMARCRNMAIPQWGSPSINLQHHYQRDFLVRAGAVSDFS